MDMNIRGIVTQVVWNINCNLVAYQIVNWERATQTHAFLAINEQCVDLVAQILLKEATRFKQGLVSCFRLLQLMMKHFDGALNVSYLLHKTILRNIPRISMIVKMIS